MKIVNFKEIPEHSRYIISCNGEIQNVYTGNVLKYYINEAGYYCLRLWSDTDEKYVIRRVHRLLAITWKPPVGNLELLDVNHKDGDKLNIVLSNLEWTTRAGNNQHAYLTGLNPNPVDVHVKDLETDQEYIYGSLKDLGKALSVSQGALRKQLKRSYLVSNGRYVVKSIYDERSWDDIIQASPQKDFKYRIFDGVTVKHMSTGEVTECKSITAAAAFTGLNRSGIRKRLDKDSLYPLKGWMFRNRSNVTEWPVWTEEALAKESPERTTRITIEEMDTGELLSFTSLADMARHFDLSPLRGSNILNSLKKYDRYKNYKLKSLSKS